MRFASRRARWAAAAAAALGLGQFTGVALALDTTAPVVREYGAPDGATYLSVSLQADGLPSQATPHDHVILIDTSASQVGEHRRHALAVLEEVLRSLPAGDRVAVTAIDVGATRLTEGLVAPADAQATALAALKRRVPAGATDLLGGLQNALSQFDGSRPGSIVVIGDGMSAAHLIQPSELAALAESLRDCRIAVHSYAVGSRTDLQLLGALATQTGGIVLHDRGETQAAEAGQKLAAAASLPVFYPESLNVQWQGAEVLPQTALPMRSDRATVYLVRGRVQPNASLSVGGTVNGEPREFAWSIPESSQTQGTTVIGHLWHDAARSQGVSMPLAGDDLVSLAQESHLQRVSALEVEGAEALRTGQKAVARNVGQVLESLEPGNVRAVAFQIGEGGFPEYIGSDPLEPRIAPPGDGPIALEVARRQALAEKLARELENEIAASRRDVSTNVGAAEARLIEALATVKSATEIDRDQQDRLIRTATSALQQIRAQRASLEARQAASQRALAERNANLQLVDQLTNEQRILRNLVDQVRAAMSDGFHGDAAAFEEAESIGRIVFSRAPGSAMGAATVFLPEAAGALDKASRLRALRSDKFLAQLHQVELSHVPFPDEPPVNYPPAEVWQYITQIRAKWKSVDLHKNSPNEERIYQALDQSVNFQFIGTTLEEVMRYIETENNITIRLDVNKLQEAGIGPDSEIQLVISGISLRAALKLMLENVQGVELAYVIDNEVMKITTKDDADLIQQTRVYPVGDLAISPIMQPMLGRMAMMMGGGMGGGMGGMGGGMGGMGGGMGGMGGGMGGMGGGMGGMGGMGGGGGFFSVPNSKLTAPEAAGLKKKP
ncbi:MAG: VWA domain-containing protein [Planctomyces sp.]|nr:VWA domain-containing protein [Planctomyces sp.]